MLVPALSGFVELLNVDQRGLGFNGLKHDSKPERGMQCKGEKLKLPRTVFGYQDYLNNMLTRAVLNKVSMSL